MSDVWKDGLWGPRGEYRRQVLRRKTGTRLNFTHAILHPQFPAHIKVNAKGVNTETGRNTASRRRDGQTQDGHPAQTKGNSNPKWKGQADGAGGGWEDERWQITQTVLTSFIARCSACEARYELDPKVLTVNRNKNCGEVIVNTAIW